ncbi:MAG: CoA-binding protein [candidate division KSB1 bacterium]|nr:CoA-binding protein [candidate division KSB1 bacterium]MDZ7303703.1 CoA-binding protein [candidate division KSB1 bacterium]MDZ7313161.1 CoA-binding protein [candidate division KSB1 bacterium]
MMTAQDILKTKKTFALVGATPDKWKYGYEVLMTLTNAGYSVLPINPKYQEIDGIKCHASLKELPQKPEVVICALAPANTEKVVEAVKEIGIEILWMPPGCWSDEAVRKCQQLNIEFVHDVCPIGTLQIMTATNY